MIESITRATYVHRVGFGGAVGSGNLTWNAKGLWSPNVPKTARIRAAFQRPLFIVVNQSSNPASPAQPNSPVSRGRVAALKIPETSPRLGQELHSLCGTKPRNTRSNRSYSRRCLWPSISDFHAEWQRPVRIPTRPVRAGAFVPGSSRKSKIAASSGSSRTPSRESRPNSNRQSLLFLYGTVSNCGTPEPAPVMRRFRSWGSPRVLRAAPL
jgi:hypothetical protein